MNSAEYLKLRAQAKTIYQQFQQEKKDADNLAKKGRLVFQPAISSATKRQHELCAMSVNDILDRSGHTGLLTDLEFKKILCGISSIMNSAKKKGSVKR